LLDAALGTRLVALGLELRHDDPAIWNLTHPELVLELHQRDVRSGSGAVLTNTFGANRFWLARFGRQRAVELINRRAVELAREAAGPDRLLFGCVGPTAAQPNHTERSGARAMPDVPVADRPGTEPGSPGLIQEEPAGAAAEQAAILVAAGVDALCFETFNAHQIESVLPEVTACSGARVPLIASLWDWPDPPDAAVGRLVELGASVIGMNCQAGIEAAVAFAERISRITARPLLVKPSAGDSGRRDGSPAAFAAAVPRLLELNVRLLGGCCGTTELHVAALADALNSAKNEARLSREVGTATV
jgi:methionine synthase I (cobalamin-dependent)